MDLYIVVLRILHLFSGVYWVGTIFFYASFLLPRVKQAGPLGGQFMQRLSAPPLPQTLTAAGLLAALSGILLYWRDSAGFRMGWIVSPTGLVFTVGGLAAIGAVVLGVVISRPAAGRLAALGGQIAAAGGQPTSTQLAEVQMLSARLERAVYQTAYMLVFTLLGMSIARYL